MAKLKDLTYQFIDPTSDVGRPLYERLFLIVDEHHPELSQANAKIALAWALAYKPDPDGIVKLGECKKASELDRQLHDFDFVILLSKDFWFHSRVTEAQRTALLDHELMHASLAYDEDGEPKRDATGRFLFRIRKHNLEEFREIVARHGYYTDDIAQFMQTAKIVEARHNSVFVGYTSVQAALKRVGIDLGIDTITAWREPERREVAIWAELRAAEPGETVNVLMAPSMPECLAAVVRPETQH